MIYNISSQKPTKKVCGFTISGKEFNYSHAKPKGSDGKSTLTTNDENLTRRRPPTSRVTVEGKGRETLLDDGPFLLESVLRCLAREGKEDEV
jgi:hypothetical protein